MRSSRGILPELAVVSVLALIVGFVAGSYEPLQSSRAFALGRIGAAELQPLADRVDGAPFSQRDLDALDQLLPSITLAVGRARMYDRVKELQHLATLDPLTGLHNRRSFRDSLAVEVHRARRQRQANIV